MTAELKKIFQSLDLKQFSPVYLLDGEEPFYLDLLTDYFEHKILQPSERDFNLTVLYGKDTDWNEVVNACRRFPMFAERQVVIVKDASQMRGLNELTGYILKPSPTTLLVLEHRFKKADGKLKFTKAAKEKGVHFTSDKVKEDRLPSWIQEYGVSIGFKVGEKSAQILASYLGSDLQKIANEIEKVRINVTNEPELTPEMIQKYIGISKEFNVFDLPQALISGDRPKLYRMLAYFITNSKAAPMPLIIGLFYGQLNKMYVANFVKGKTDKDAAAAMGTSPYFIKETLAMAQQWPLARVERCLLLLGEYSTKAVGIKNTTNDRELLKEMIGLMME